jgi:hypothetical protein
MARAVAAVSFLSLAKFNDHSKPYAATITANNHRSQQQLTTWTVILIATTRRI